MRLRRRTLPEPPACEWPYRVGIVRWVDAHPEPGWLDPDDMDAEPHVNVSVGYVLPLGTKPDHLTLAQDWSPAGHVNGVGHIPQGDVLSIRFLNG